MARSSVILFLVLSFCRPHSGPDDCTPTSHILPVRDVNDLERIHRELRRRTHLVSGERSDLLFEKESTSTLFATESHFGSYMYGRDGRREPSPRMSDALKRNISATVAMIPRILLREDGDVYRLEGAKTLADEHICKTDRFSDQLSPARCNALLVGPNVILTAAHCAGPVQLANHYFVLDFRVDDRGQTPTTFKHELVRSAACVLAHSNDVPGDLFKEDWALVSLDGDPIQRTIPPRRSSGQIRIGEPVYLIGCPRGIPMKYSPGARVRNNTADRFFVANLDGFTFESGAPVFNAITDEMEGIYVRGEIDLVDHCGCKTAVRCTNQGCRGEDVTRIMKVDLATAMSACPTAPSVQKVVASAR